MPRVVEIRTLLGDLLGTCSAKCYDAEPDTNPCQCVCRGANHGKGVDVALLQADEIASSWGAVAKSTVAPEARQLFLIDPRTVPHQSKARARREKKARF